MDKNKIKTLVTLMNQLCGEFDEMWVAEVIEVGPSAKEQGVSKRVQFWRVSEEYADANRDSGLIFGERY